VPKARLNQGASNRSAPAVPEVPTDFVGLRNFITMPMYNGSPLVNEITGTGNASADTAVLQAAHDALPATGGEIRLKAGSTFVLGAAGLVITKPVKIIGGGKSAGPASSAGGYPTETSVTRIEYPFATGTAITVNANACVFQDFHLINTNVTAPTAGEGILHTTGFGAGTLYRSISVSGFYRNVNHANGFEWAMVDCTLFDFVSSGLRISNPALPDAGDMGVINCQIIAGPNRTAASYGIEWVTAGGLRVHGCKFNKRGAGTFTIAIFLHPADGSSTSVFDISDNSIENSTYGVYSDDTGNTGSGSISKISVKDNEFSTLAGGKAIAFSRLQVGKTSVIQIKDNIITSASTVGGISLAVVDTVTVGGNTYGTNIVTAAGKLTLGANVTNLVTTDNVIDSNTTSGTTGTVVLNGATPVVVSTTAVTAKSNIQLTQQVAGGTQSGIAFVVSRVVGTSFTINSVALDTSTVGWVITEPLN
jgi:hypothetical protein